MVEEEKLFPNGPILYGDDAQSVVGAYAGLVTTAQAMLESFIGKRGIVPPKFVGSVGPAVRSLRYESEYYSGLIRGIKPGKDYWAAYNDLRASFLAARDAYW
ncbi:hypothetical protein BV20DRAFT_963006 [Pilatotrama ljubarskyi]|nr:hypothetical protein BV20DRAFT_963006 [Pilatotrama ljubarskyi]